jgi:hypothetical protein
MADESASRGRTRACRDYTGTADYGCPVCRVRRSLGTNPEGLNPAASAVTGAIVTNWVTFLPSFLFIVVGAPYIEVLRGNRNLTGALSGITAAVVGVLLNLAMVFGTTVLWPRGMTAWPDGLQSLWVSVRLLLCTGSE